MSIWKRIRVYFIGFGLGLLLTYFFFGDRACGGWLPGNRVKSSITEFQFLTSDFMDCQMEAVNYTPDSLVSFIVESDVVFNKSDVKGNPKTYYLTNGEKAIDFVLNFDDSTVFIKELPFNEFSECQVLSKNKTKKVKLPVNKY